MLIPDSDKASGATGTAIPEQRETGPAPLPLPGLLLRFASRLLPDYIPVTIKLAISIGIMISVGMAILGVVVIHNQTQLLNRQIHTFGRTLVSQLAQSAREPLLANDSLQLDVLAYNLAAAENVIGTAIYSSEFKILSSSGTSPFETFAPYADRQQFYLNSKLRTLVWQWPDSPTGELDAISFLSPIRFKDVTAGHVIITFSRKSMNQAIGDSVQSIVTATAVLILLGIIMSYLLGRRLSRPIHHLVNASRAIGKGEYEYRIEERRNDEIGHLMNSFNFMAQGMLQKQQVESAFTRHVSPHVAREIINNIEPVKLGGQHMNGSVMFVDIVGFTARSETMDPEGVAELLNEFYTHITQTAHLFHGTIDKYMGDCAMLIFGIAGEDPEHTYHAIAYAVFLQRLMERYNSQRISRGKFPLHLRIGVNSGDMLAGNMGSSERMQFTVVGDTVNLASRLCSVADTDQIVITEETWKLPGIREKLLATEYQRMHVRGKSQQISTWLVHDVRPELQVSMEREIDRLLMKSTQLNLDLLTDKTP